jgi:hypothetical protein
MISSYDTQIIYKPCLGINKNAPDVKTGKRKKR